MSSLESAASSNSSFKLTAVGRPLDWSCEQGPGYNRLHQQRIKLVEHDFPDQWLLGEWFHEIVPRTPYRRFMVKGLRNEFSYFFSRHRDNRTVLVTFVELRAREENVDSRVKSLEAKK